MAQHKYISTIIIISISIISISKEAFFLYIFSYCFGHTFNVGDQGH